MTIDDAEPDQGDRRRRARRTATGFATVIENLVLSELFQKR